MGDVLTVRTRGVDEVEETWQRFVPSARIHRLDPRTVAFAWNSVGLDGFSAVAWELTASTTASIHMEDQQTIVIGHGDAQETLSYDVLHAVPPQRAPEWIAGSGLAASDDPQGFVDVDPETLQHVRHPEIWAVGDAASVATRRSGGTIRQQAKALVKNMTAVRAGRLPSARYDGYSVVPFTVSRGTVVFAEFDRTGRLRPTIPFWRSPYRERRLSWIADRRILPWVYWHLILRGRA